MDKMPVKSQNTLKSVRIGTRGSPLARAQTQIVARELARIDPNLIVETKIIRTSGDWLPEHGEAALAEAGGGKALFAKELEQALFSDEIDVAVHSMKDMEVPLPAGLCIPYMLPRADAHDVFLSNIAQKIEDLPNGSSVGTVSVRRAAMLRSVRPDLRIVPLRGNVQTRLDKLKAGQVDSIILAAAGMSRLGIVFPAVSMMAPEIMVPCAGQGAVGLEILDRKTEELSVFSQLNCLKTYQCVSLERAVLLGLKGGCHTPIGAYVCPTGEGFNLLARLFSPDGAQYIQEAALLSSDYEAALLQAENIGKQLRSRAPAGSLDPRRAQA